MNLSLNSLILEVIEGISLFFISDIMLTNSIKYYKMNIVHLNKDILNKK